MTITNYIMIIIKINDKNSINVNNTPVDQSNQRCGDRLLISILSPDGIHFSYKSAEQVSFLFFFFLLPLVVVSPCSLFPSKFR